MKHFTNVISVVSDNTARNVWYAEEPIMPSCITGLKTGSEAESLLKREPCVVLSRPPTLPGPRGVGLLCTQAVVEGDKYISPPPNLEFSSAGYLRRLLPSLAE